MRYVAAYLLAVLGGKANPGKNDVTAILESIGLDVDCDKLDKVSKILWPKSLLVDIFTLFSIVNLHYLCTIGCE